MFKKKSPGGGGAVQPPNPRSTPPRNTDWTAPPRNRPPEHPILPPFPPPKTPIREALGARPARARPRRGLWRRGSVFCCLFCVFCLSPGRPRNHPTEHTPGRRLHWGPRQTPQTPKNTPQNSKKHQKRHKTIRKTQSK